MSPLLEYLWPALGLGAAIGAIAGSIVFRRKLERGPRWKWLAAAASVAIAGALLWSGPLGGADRFAARIERDARLTLDNYEMFKVQARLARGPMKRTLLLKGPGNDFQRGEMVRVLSTLPGVSEARWSPKRSALPLFAEGAMSAFAGFLLGLFLAYLLELHRRYNAQWDW